MPSRLRQAWKTLPEPLRRQANLAAHAAGRAALPVQVALTWRRGQAAGPPLAVAGFHDAVLGIGQGARLFVDALRGSGAEVGLIDALHALAAAAPGASRPAAGGVLVSHLNPPELERYLIATRARDLRGRRHVGYWSWELPVAPSSWRRAFDYVDEVWAPSSFTAQALRGLAPPGTTVRVVPHPVFATPMTPPDRARFRLPAEACLVLQAFDLRSTVARKNPYGAIEAYVQAVPEPRPEVRIVCKVVGGRTFPADLAMLKDRLAERPDAILITNELDATDMLRLVASVDILLSLHRAEGFGLVLAEAMWLGKPVVATAWSGNMDFMDEDSSAAVRWTAAPVQDPQGMYAGAEWAEPDIGDAAAKLARLITDPAEREALGRRARARALQVFDRDAWLSAVWPALAGRDPPERGAAA